jgi:glycosyltransferase involved in cell wall biosynthesis/Fe2+ transport system protein FeoA
MGSGLTGRMPAPVKRKIRQAARQAARVRRTRAWLVVRPIYQLARHVVDPQRLLAPEPRPPGELEVGRYRQRLLNLGFVERALVDLRHLAADGSDPLRARLAAWELALWYADQSAHADVLTALEFLEQAGAGEPDPDRLRAIAIMEAECRHRAGDLDAARQAIVRAEADRGPDPDTLLAAANLEPDASARLDGFNRALAYHGRSQVALATPATGAPFDHLSPTTGAAAGPAPRTTPLVTVIVPAYNATGTIRTALDSLRAQTWPHLEILVVDDASTDATAEVVASYAARDPRIRLIRTGRNGGTYVARNLALQAATGEFVTCHDTDDWSHPEKIEQQVRHLLAHRSVVANTSQQVRATPDLRFYRRGKPGYYVFQNFSSLMFRRKRVLAELGFWDTVRFGADSELARRLTRTFGTSALVDLPTGPLSLQRQSDTSLTGSPAFGYHGFFFGARKEYDEASTYYHQRAGTLRYEFPQPSRPFAVPEPMLPDRSSQRGQRRHFDVIIASDFRMVGGSTLSSVEEIEAQTRLGLRTGLVQMASYDGAPRGRIRPEVRDQLDGDRVQMLVHGERASCDLLIVRYPPVLREWQRFLPDVTAGQIRVIVNQPPMSDYGPDAVLRYDIASCQENLPKYFGQSGTWHPISPVVRQALHLHHADDLPLIDLSDQDWVNIIDVDAWRRPGRPAPRRRPRIGRHARDTEVKWPATAAELLAAYPDSPRYEVRILGGATVPEAMLGRIPDNWRVTGFDELSPQEFLAGLDVFVYYPNPAWVESFGRVVLEAMATGVPVILPDTFRPLFGGAAIYAEPAAALAEVNRLMRDTGYYETRVDLAQRFVEREFGYRRHQRRIGLPKRT